MAILETDDMGKSKKAKAAPNRLAKLGKNAGVELNEKELGQTSGGCATGEHLKVGLLPAV